MILIIFYSERKKEKKKKQEEFILTIPTRKMGRVFYLVILEALTVRSVSRVNSLKIRIAMRFNRGLKAQRIELLKRKREYTRVSKQAAYLTPCQRNLFNSLYLLHCGPPNLTYILPNNQKLFRVISIHLEQFEIIRPPFTIIKYPSNVNRNVKEFSL